MHCIHDSHQRKHWSMLWEVLENASEYLAEFEFLSIDKTFKLMTAIISMRNLIAFNRGCHEEKLVSQNVSANCEQIEAVSIQFCHSARNIYCILRLRISGSINKRDDRSERNLPWLDTKVIQVNERNGNGDLWVRNFRDIFFTLIGPYWKFCQICLILYVDFNSFYLCVPIRALASRRNNIYFFGRWENRCEAPWMLR